MVTSSEREQERQRVLRKLEKQIQGLHNEMEFVEILAQFWPWSNMTEKVKRLEHRIQSLRCQHDTYAGHVRGVGRGPLQGAGRS